MQDFPECLDGFCFVFFRFLKKERKTCYSLQIYKSLRSRVLKLLKSLSINWWIMCFVLSAAWLCLGWCFVGVLTETHIWKRYWHLKYFRLQETAVLGRPSDPSAGPGWFLTVLAVRPLKEALPKEVEVERQEKGYFLRSKFRHTPVRANIFSTSAQMDGEGRTMVSSELWVTPTKRLAY